MQYVSSKNPNVTVLFEEAVMRGIAPDGGLYMPIQIPVFAETVLANMASFTFHEVAYHTVKPFVGEEIEDTHLRQIIQDAYDFDAPLTTLDERYSILELFHGPTLAFKDFGARFMARVMAYFNQKYNRELLILVATSGDTGSAVANGFLGVPGIQVILLYPSRMVSEIQEKQLTTLGQNITALEVEGTFDDCQRLVKTAFLDEELRQVRRLSSANSINIARLIPQMIYYVYTWSRLPYKKQLVFSVPSGNLGNLTAGLFAHRMGIPVSYFIAALNRNNIFQEYLKKGKFQSRKAIPTISNAMDVGNPSNLARIQALFDNNIQKIREKIRSYSFDDDQTFCAIQEVYQKYEYIIDPHGAVGYLAAKEDFRLNGNSNLHYIILETAHAAKFKRNVETVLDREISMPPMLEKCLKAEKKSIRISPLYKEFKEFLMSSVITI